VIKLKFSYILFILIWIFCFQSTNTYTSQRCCNGRPAYLIHLEQIKLQLDRMGKTQENTDIPYFSFNFNHDYTHDYLAVPDDFDKSLKELLVDLQRDGALDNTLVIFFTDHGKRGDDYSRTDQGRVEHHSPFLSIRLPKSLQNTHFSTMLKHNKNKLITNFDIYQTLKQFLYMNKYPLRQMDAKCRGEFVKNSKQIRSQRGVSLFENIPTNRSCCDALVSFLYCPCFNSSILTEAQLSRLIGASSLIDLKSYLTLQLNSITQSLRNKCAQFEFKEFLKIKEKRGPNDCLYEFLFQLTPGNVIFHTKLSYDDNKKNKFKILNRIVRSNLYRNQSKCIEQLKKPNLMQYCYCIR
jgi:hypothetical protein